jgi:S-adenosyl-L-methionine hydrolase (adenosine-forming)
MAHRVITLTTDFGTSDHYVAAMKGVILGICPGASIVDLTHEVAAYEIPQAAYLVAQTYASFPPRTIHVVVVDPGVGTARRPILAEAARQYFIAPDNGVLSMLYSREEGHKVRAITAERYFRKPVSQTFHGRDVFAPSAAHLAAGVSPAKLGKRIEDYLRGTFERPVRTGKRTWTGTVLHIDHFGNLITNFRMEDVRGTFELVLGPHRVGVLARNYAECGPGEPFSIVGSGGYLEISVNQASAARLLGCGVGAPVELVLTS